MKIAFATQDLKNADAHFGWAANIAIYELGPERWHHLNTVVFEDRPEEDGNEDKLMARIEAIKDCALLYVTAIGGSAAARVVAKKVHPIKLPSPEPIEALLLKLQAVLNGVPPPFLRKAMLRDQERSMDFETGDLAA